MAVGTSITLSGWCVLSGLVIGYSNLPLSTAISPVPLSFADVGLLVDGLCLPFANRLLRTTGLLLLFSVKVPAADFSQRRFLCLFGLALRLFDFPGIASLFLLSFAKTFVTDFS